MISKPTGWYNRWTAIKLKCYNTYKNKTATIWKAKIVNRSIVVKFVSVGDKLMISMNSKCLIVIVLHILGKFIYAICHTLWVNLLLTKSWKNLSECTTFPPKIEYKELKFNGNTQVQIGTFVPWVRELHI